MDPILDIQHLRVLSYYFDLDCQHNLKLNDDVFMENVIGLRCHVNRVMACQLREVGGLHQT